MPEIATSDARQAEIAAARVAVRAAIWTRKDGTPRDDQAPPRIARLVDSAAIHAALSAHETDSNDDLATQYRTGDESAALALYARYRPLIEGMAKAHGTCPVFDADDAHQEAVTTLLESALAETGTPFGARVENEVRDRVANESIRSRFPSTVSRRVWIRVRDFLAAANDDVQAAASLAASHPNPRERMPRESFLAAYHAIYGGLATLDDAHQKSDPAAEAAFAAVEEDQDPIGRLAEQAGLTAREVEIARAAIGRNGEVPLRTQVAAEFGISNPAVTQILAKVRTKLAPFSDQLHHVEA